MKPWFGNGCRRMGMRDWMGSYEAQTLAEIEVLMLAVWLRLNHILKMWLSCRVQRLMVNTTKSYM
jgi:hypothetical protein